MRFTQAVVLILVIMAAIGAYPGNRPGASETIEVLAKRYTFEPQEITVHKGEVVTLDVSTEDVVHGLVVEELGIRTEVKKGQHSEVTFTPTETGTFVGKCAHFCGAGHGSMGLTIHVTE